jgi:pimeloyl-ACP methyl ester carboxylesterase
MLFVHGFGGRTNHFAPQLEHFKRRCRVVAIDRRGHGQSDKPEGPYTIGAIAEEVAWTARELGLYKPVLVAHSMGVIALEVAHRYPDLASALVLIDAPIFLPREVEGAFQQLLQGLRSPAYADVIAQTCDQLIFLPTDDRARRERLHAEMLETPQHVLASTWEHFLAYDAAPAAAHCKLPLLCIAAVMPSDETRLRELCPQLWVGRTVGAGHFPQLEVPAQVNAMVERFLALNTNSTPSRN